ncbi:MAG: hypothetical protein EU543_00530 [Promethearchaeota archaeon]|nr:MAG: hypothetical protein EU543_00530 [Candidatus Lokiarchaeota archaeon]
MNLLFLLFFLYFFFEFVYFTFFCRRTKFKFSSYFTLFFFSRFRDFFEIKLYRFILVHAKIYKIYKSNMLGWR